jgi:hypothetical protein
VLLDDSSASSFVMADVAIADGSRGGGMGETEPDL